MKTESVTSSKSTIVTAKTNLKEKEIKLSTWVKAKKAMIADVANCNQCGLCMQQCKVGAIEKVGE